MTNSLFHGCPHLHILRYGEIPAEGKAILPLQGRIRIRNTVGNTNYILHVEQGEWLYFAVKAVLICERDLFHSVMHLYVIEFFKKTTVCLFYLQILVCLDHHLKRSQG